MRKFWAEHPKAQSLPDELIERDEFDETLLTEERDLETMTEEEVDEELSGKF